MKIGILTFHHSINNGAVMQAYSLSKRLQSEFPEARVEIIDYQMKKINEAYSCSLRSYLKSPSLMVFIKKAVKLVMDPLQIERLKRRTQVFADCASKLPLSERQIIDDGTDELFDYVNKNYDVVVVGSDAVWNYISRVFPSAYLPDNRLTVPKLSYAASCYGMDFLTRPEHERDQLRDSLDSFEFLGVRDSATADFVKWSGSTSVTHQTCDPTAFLDVDDLPIDVELLKIKLIKRGFDFSRETIGMMGTDKMLKMIRSFYGNKYQIVSLYNYVRGADVNLYDLEPYEWAYVFKYFKLTFTTYFHGTLLSLRNGVPLICIALETEFAKAHTPKTLDVLTRLGFEDWYFHTDYQATNLDKIKSKADQLLSRDHKSEIIEAIDKDALSFDAFRAAMKNIIDKEVK